MLKVDAYRASRIDDVRFAARHDIRIYDSVAELREALGQDSTDTRARALGT
jgi:hypothetical protein